MGLTPSCSLTGLQAVLPGYLRGPFIQAALNYVGCNSEGQFSCRGGDCWCQCSADFPQCNCPRSDLDELERSLLRIREAWRAVNQEFEESGENLTPPLLLLPPSFSAIMTSC